MSVYATIEQLICVTTERNLIELEDRGYVRNRVMSLLQLTTFPENVSRSSSTAIPQLLDELLQYAVETEVIENIFDEKEILKATIMDCFTPRPSVINETFYQLYENSPEEATAYFYELSKNNNYIQTEQVKKNIHYPVDTSYGTFDITINLSKPEKDPEQIKRERAMKPTNVAYPPCVLCKENVGYAGRTGHPARANHRIISVPLLEEKWYLQYSPYVYYNEHSILLYEEHRPMKIDRDTFTRLLNFVEQFPHYFIGSNADLPIVGGSILNHDHYQAGHYKFAMTHAELLSTFSIKGMNDVTCQLLKWPLSVIRLQGNLIGNLVETADHILSK